VGPVSIVHPYRSSTLLDSGACRPYTKPPNHLVPDLPRFIGEVGSYRGEAQNRIEHSPPDHSELYTESRVTREERPSAPPLRLSSLENRIAPSDPLPNLLHNLVVTP
jgi:hypothetical protein